MKKKFIAMLTITTMTLSLLVGCGQSATPNTNEDTSTVQNTEVKESGDDVVVATEEPIVAEVVEDVVAEVVEEESVTINYEYAYDLKFPNGMTGFTKKYLNETVPEWSLNETHYVDTNGNEMNFEWEGFATLGESAGVSTGHPTLILIDADGNYTLRAWTYGTVDEVKFAMDLEYSKETWTSFASVDIPYVENGYYDIQTTDTTIEVVFEVANDTQKGYDYYVVDLNRGTCYQFTYLENNEVYDNSRAMFVINSIDFWDYIPEE